MFDIFLEPHTYIALLSLTFLEIVLGIDNIIFISIVTNKLPEQERKKARTIGLILALVFRIFLLSVISYIIKANTPLFSVFTQSFSVRDLILLSGGIFLIWKSIIEISHKVDEESHLETQKPQRSFLMTLLQIVMLDIVFSFDSILTAIGLSNELLIMISAVVISMIAMIQFSGYISDFINKHTSLQILALAFLILIGFILVMEAFHHEIPKGYIYFALFFSMSVELINIQIKKKQLKKKH